nr:putative UPF0481 protein At3g02645 [Tanacetum cinerariifolium]
MNMKLCRFACFPWSYGKPRIEMPVLRDHHFTELVFRNIIAYDQSSSLGYHYVTSYVIAIDMLIDTQEDVVKLVESKVLVNNMGSNEEAENMMNSICKKVAWVHFGPSKDWKKLDTYRKNYWPKNIAWLRRTYFSNPWSIIALVAGMVLFALTKFNRKDCSLMTTPMDLVEKLKRNTVGRLSKLTSNPSRQHWHAIIRVFKYLKGTINYGFSYVGYPSALEAYLNASRINHVEDSSSTSGWVFLLGGGAISWESKKQTCITCSNMEYEFVALADASKAT